MDDAGSHNPGRRGLLSTSGASRRRRWTFWLGLVISLGCVVWAAWALDWRQVGATLSHASPWLTAAAIVAIIVSTFPRVWRWQALFVKERPPLEQPWRRCWLGR